MRRTTWWGVALFVAAVLGASGPAVAKTTIRVATETAQPDPTWELANKFKELAEAKRKARSR